MAQRDPFQDRRAALRQALAADADTMATLWPTVVARAPQLRDALPAHLAVRGNRVADLLQFLTPVVPYFLTGAAFQGSRVVGLQHPAYQVVPFYRIGNYAHPDRPCSGREPGTWSQWIARGDLPLAPDASPVLRSHWLGDYVGPDGLHLRELCPSNGGQGTDLFQADPTNTSTRWMFVITRQGEPAAIVTCGGVFYVNPVLRIGFPYRLTSIEDLDREEQAWQAAGRAAFRDVHQAAPSVWLQLMDALPGLNDLVCIRPDTPEFNAWREDRTTLVRDWLTLRSEQLDADVVLDTPEATEQAHAAMLKRLLDYPDDRRFTPRAAPLPPIHYEPPAEHVVAKPMTKPPKTGIPLPLGRGKTRRHAATPVAGPAAAADTQAVQSAQQPGQTHAIAQMPAAQPEVEARLKRIGERLALAPATWSKLERSLRCFLMRDPAAPRGIILHGPPGTGKTTIAKAIAAEAQCSFTALSAPDIKQQYLGASGQKVKEIWDTATKAAPAIIFIDECDAIFQKRGGLDADKMTDEVVSAILPRMDGMAPGAGILVIGATNRFDSLDPAIASRFDLAVPVPLPDADARRKILASAFATFRFTGAPAASLVNATDGMSGRELEALVRSARQDVLAGESPETVFDRSVETWRARSGAKVDRSLSWDDVVVADATRTALQRCATMLARREELMRLGLDVMPKGILLTGPPGTGKTQLARVMAATAGVGFITATTSDLKAGYVGQSGQRVKEIFARARGMSPCILFIDEIDIVAPARGGTGDAFTQEVIGQILQELDGVVVQDTHVFLMAATNAPDAIDGAVLSRFSDRIEVPLPDRDQRAQIVRVLLKGRPVVGDPLAIAAAVADQNPGASGRDLKNLVEAGLRRAATRALNEPGAAIGLQISDLAVPTLIANPA